MIPSSISAVGWLKSRVLAAASTIAAESLMSPSTYWVEPSGPLASSARAWVSTIGSLSTYTIRESGATAWATSWVLFADGMPVPMSRNCLIPSSADRYRTARARNARFARTRVRSPGVTASTRSAASRSAAKLSLPPSQ